MKLLLLKNHKILYEMLVKPQDVFEKLKIEIEN